MQLRALIKTRKPKWAMIVLGVVVCAAAVWVLRYVSHAPTDDEKYRGMFRSYNRGARVAGFRRSHGFPAPLDRLLLEIQMRSLKRGADLSTELKASGYVAEFLVTNENAGVFALTNELAPGPYWRVLMETNVLFVTCRSGDAPQIRASLEKKP